MKKLIFILAFALVGCGKIGGAEDSKGNKAEVVTKGTTTYYSVSAVDYYTAGMHYKVFNSAPGNIFVVNVTLDSINANK